MEITNVSKMYQTKLQEINSRLPNQTSIKDKFSSYLESAKLKNTSSEETPVTTQENLSSTDTNLDTNQLLNSLLTYNSGLNQASSLFSTTTSDNSMFPSMNNSLQVLQQAALLKSLKSDNK